MLVLKTLVFPAPAGINRWSRFTPPEKVSVPRASGDKPSNYPIWYSDAGCSPRQRG